MKSKQEILNTIDTRIISNGNILATETNAILHDMMDFSDSGMKELNTNITNIDRRVTILEGETSGSGLDGFTVFDDKPLLDKNQNLFWYSFRGIEKHFVNFTFRLLIQKGDNQILEFDAPSRIFEKLQGIIVHQEESQQFVVAVRNKERGKNFPVSISFFFSEKGVRIHLISLGNDNGIGPGDSIYTSIALHQPDFSFSF